MNIFYSWQKTCWADLGFLSVSLVLRWVLDSFKALYNKFKGSLRLNVFQVIEPHGKGFQVTVASTEKFCILSWFIGI